MLPKQTMPRQTTCPHTICSPGRPCTHTKCANQGGHISRAGCQAQVPRAPRVPIQLPMMSMVPSHLPMVSSHLPMVPIHLPMVSMVSMVLRVSMVPIHSPMVPRVSMVLRVLRMPMVPRVSMVPIHSPMVPRVSMVSMVLRVSMVPIHSPMVPMLPMVSRVPRRCNNPPTHPSAPTHTAQLAKLCKQRRKNKLQARPPTGCWRAKSTRRSFAHMHGHARAHTHTCRRRTSWRAKKLRLVCGEPSCSGWS